MSVFWFWLSALAPSKLLTAFKTYRMATKLLHKASSVSKLGLGLGSKSSLCAKGLSNSASHIPPAPVKTSFGLGKTFAVAIPGILVGSTMAKNGAAWLEENEIFIPDDDDDD